MLLLQQISLAESEGVVVATDQPGRVLSVLLLQDISLAESECVIVAGDQPGRV